MDQGNVHPALAGAVSVLAPEPTAKPVPKSLHTVRVLVVFARSLMAAHNFSEAEAVRSALVQLGYGDTPDAYGLAAAAVRQLQAVQS